MKIKLLMIFLSVNASVYALNMKIWDDFNKAYRAYANQSAQATQKRQEAGKIGFKFYDSDVKKALYSIQVKKSDSANLAQYLIDELKKIKNKSKISSETQNVLADYFDALQQAIKNGKDLTEAFTRLMSATDDAPKTFAQKRAELMQKVGVDFEKPKIIEVSVSWKKEAAAMIKKIEQELAFQQGAAAYRSMVGPLAVVYPERIELVVRSEEKAEKYDSCAKALKAAEIKISELEALIDQSISKLDDVQIQREQIAKELKESFTMYKNKKGRKL